MPVVDGQGGLYTPTQNNFQSKKQGPSPISLVRATRIFSKAKTMKKKMICHWTFEKIEKEVFFRLRDHSSITSAKRWVGGPKKAKNMLT